jgi:inner membrane protein
MVMSMPGLAALESNAPANPEIAFVWEERGSLERLRQLKAENCHVEAWLRFARAPSLGETTALDARFATSTRGNFTAMDFAQFRSRECARFVPQWDFPRADLLAVPRK